MFPVKQTETLIRLSHDNLKWINNFRAKLPYRVSAAAVANGLIQSEIGRREKPTTKGKQNAKTND